MQYSVRDLPAVLRFGVADPQGDVIETYAKRGQALERVAALNSKLRADRAPVDAFHAAQAREFIARAR
jgi:hypothetical protein